MMSWFVRKVELLGEFVKVVMRSPMFDEQSSLMRKFYALFDHTR
jgi:hypothetical protein